MLAAAAVCSDAAAEPVRLPRDSGVFGTARALVPGSFRTVETEHFVILSDSPRRHARDRGRLLEATYRQFQLHAARLQLHPQALRHKLVCVLFRTRDEFAAFAREHDGVTATWCLGYYSLRHDRVVFFDVESDRDSDEFAEARAIAATAHEAAHYLHFHTGLQAATVQYPLWCGEGLATAFETSAPDEPFGPLDDFGPRRMRFRRLLQANRLIPLRTFIQLDRITDEPVQTVYNQSYALASWLARERPGELRDYLLSMLSEAPGRPAPQRHLELFERAFGDVSAVEESWLRYETRLEESP